MLFVSYLEQAVYYLRQLNEVNGGDTVFVRCPSVRPSVCLSVCVRSGPVNQTSLKRFKFDVHVSKDIKRVGGQGHVTPQFLDVKC